MKERALELQTGFMSNYSLIIFDAAQEAADAAQEAADAAQESADAAQESADAP